jgi:pimeloyl-ACP methyl ester carboxylesterase
LTVDVTDRLIAPEWFADAIAREGTPFSIEVNGATIAYRVWGEGTKEPVILLHGGAAHSHWWDHIAPLLSADRQVIAFDLSGHGDSDHRDSYGVETWAIEALALARLASSSSPILIGHSLGGVVALQAAMTNGAELGGIVIVDSPIVSFTPEEDAAADRLAFGPPRLYPTRDAILARFRPIPDQPTLDYVKEYVASTSIREVPGGWSWKFDSRIFDHAPQLPDLAALNCRSAFFRGDLGIVSAEMAEAIFERLGAATLMVDVPDAGHHIMLDQPLALVTALRTVLAAWDLAGTSSG